MIYSYHRVFLLVYYINTISPLVSSSNVDQFIFRLCNFGFEFSPFDEEILLLFETDVNSIIKCALNCLTTVRCRTFNFDTGTKHCRLYEGDIDSTGVVIASLSPKSICGSLKLNVKDFTDYGSSCSICENSRYLTCVNATCQCQPNTFFNGSICLSQKFNGTGCTNDNQCRNDINLTCLANMQCGFTTARPVHNSTCVNQTWSSSTNRLAQWLFNGNFLDQMNNYNLTSNNNISFTTNGYNQQAIIAGVIGNSTLVAPYIPLSSVSFTVDTWLFITGFTNLTTSGIFSLCSQTSADHCLQLVLRQINSFYYLYMGFFSDDCAGVTPLTLNTWIHAAFVFDLQTLTQKIYLNGVLEISCNVSSFLNVATTANTTLGDIPLFRLYSSCTSFRGYIDQMTVSNRAKPFCEILEIATLVAYFTFDNGLFLNDSGPNSFQVTTQSTSSVSSGRFSQAISFDGTNSSYFQMSGFTALGTSNKSFSISLWLRPTTLLGIVVHVSSDASGNGWCMPFLGFALNGSLLAQMYNGGGVVSVADSTFSVGTLFWSHIVQTWSSTNGLRLYVNDVLVASRLISATTYSASSVADFLTLGSVLNATTGNCSIGQVNVSPYKGDMDDFRVYSRELSASDVATLYYN